LAARCCRRPAPRSRPRPRPLDATAVAVEADSEEPGSVEAGCGPACGTPVEGDEIAAAAIVGTRAGIAAAVAAAAAAAGAAAGAERI
jgi:hypothetical protein